MKMKLSKKILSAFLALLMAATTLIVPFYAMADEEKNGKYVKEVFIAYGYTVDEAKNWLTSNGWEPVGEDLNAGNTSENVGFKNAVAVMGIKRTNNANDAITDMATMNMKGGYSFDDYQSLLNEKKADIDEFIKTFIPVLEEYRANYNGEGSEGGQKRAQFAHDLLNKFYDGGQNEDYAGNDTGMPLGDLFLNKTTTELEKEYSELTAEEKKTTADLRQIIMESTGPAVSLIEEALSFATDTRDSSWLDLLKTLTGDSLKKNVQKYVDAAKGKKLTTSQAKSYLNTAYQDSAKKLQSEWGTIHDNVLWFEKYCADNDLWHKEDETDDEYESRAAAYFDSLKETDEDRYNKELDLFNDVGNYYTVIKDVTYSGAWGKTLYDFFADPNGKEPGNDVDNFLPLAAVLSPGQRAGIKFLSLGTLLKLGSTSEEVMAAQFPKINELFKDETKDAISVYSGRNGVALTSKARMQKDMGEDPYDAWLSDGGYGDIITYSMMGVGLVMLTIGTVMVVRSYKVYKAAEAALNTYKANIASLSRNVKWCTRDLNFYKGRLLAARYVKNRDYTALSEVSDKLFKARQDLDKAEQALAEAQAKAAPELPATKMSVTGRWMMGIGGAIMILTAVAKIVEITAFYDREFTIIPTMIVDEADIVNYSTDENGKQVKEITFDQFAYYEVVKCNRQEIGLHKNAQDGVDEYDDWGCGDAADLNADVGKQWLALYVNRSSAKGNPILADSITVQYGSSGTPKGCTGNLHMFTFTNPVDVGDAAYCFRNDKNGTYLFWDSDKEAYSTSTETASAINYGYLALAAVGGLALGIVVTTFFILPKRKKENGAE